MRKRRHHDAGFKARVTPVSGEGHNPRAGRSRSKWPGRYQRVPVGVKALIGAYDLQ